MTEVYFLYSNAGVGNGTGLTLPRMEVDFVAICIVLVMSLAVNGCIELDTLTWRCVASSFANVGSVHGKTIPLPFLLAIHQVRDDGLIVLLRIDRRSTKLVFGR
jgi:hypothetical protein